MHHAEQHLPSLIAFLSRGSAIPQKYKNPDQVDDRGGCEYEDGSSNFTVKGGLTLKVILQLALPYPNLDLTCRQTVGVGGTGWQFFAKEVCQILGREIVIRSVECSVPTLPLLVLCPIFQRRLLGNTCQPSGLEVLVASLIPDKESGLHVASRIDIEIYLDNRIPTTCGYLVGFFPIYEQNFLST